MYTRVKTTTEIDAMREGGRILAKVLQKVKENAAPGVTGKHISAVAGKELKALGGEPAFLGYFGYPDIICISVNDAVVHGIPNDTPFKEGDIIGFDFGVTYKGMITDAAFSMCIGDPNAAKRRLLEATERSLYAGIHQVKNGVRVGDIGSAIQAVLDKEGFGIVRDLVGHGVGHHVHEDPNILNYGQRGSGPMLKAGMTIAIEPMATVGDYAVHTAADGWTVLTNDGSLAAHFEHTVLITEDGFEILTA